MKQMKDETDEDIIRSGQIEELSESIRVLWKSWNLPEEQVDGVVSHTAEILNKAKDVHVSCADDTFYLGDIAEAIVCGWSCGWKGMPDIALAIARKEGTSFCEAYRYVDEDGICQVDDVGGRTDVEIVMQVFDKALELTGIGVGPWGEFLDRERLSAYIVEKGFIGIVRTGRDGHEDAVIYGDSET